MHPEDWLASRSSPVTSRGTVCRRITAVALTTLLASFATAAQITSFETRPGDATTEAETSVSEASVDDAAARADAARQARLDDVLSRQATQPDDPELRAERDALLREMVAEAARALTTGQFDRAQALVHAVEAVDASVPGVADLGRRLAHYEEVRRLLDAADAALSEGRIHQPEADSAWAYFRAVLVLDPDNREARAGLVAVQQAMIREALVLARDRDFDGAEQMLEKARTVHGNDGLVESGRAELVSARQRYADSLTRRAIDAMASGKFDTAERMLIDLIALGGQDARVQQLRNRMKEARHYGGRRPGDIIHDHFVDSGSWAPESVVISAGSFQMGSPQSEKGRAENEAPLHRVTFEHGFAIGRREVTVGEFRTFVDATGYVTDAERQGKSSVYDERSGRLTERQDVDWQMNYEGRPAEPDMPVIHVSWNDAQAYVTWLARGTGKPFRLPSEAEFEYALRGGTTTRFWWGDESPMRPVENLTGDGDESRNHRGWAVAFPDYEDHFWGPAPAASFEPNPFGLYDIGGNVAEWVSDCWHDTYVRAPADGSAWVNPGCGQRVIRGGYWASSPEQTRSAYRLYGKADYHGARIGFRIARDL